MPIAYLQRHLNKHEKLLNANPNSFSLHMLGNGGSLSIREAAQELVIDTK